MAPISPRATSRQAGSSTRMSQPGTAAVGEPGLTGSVSIPTQLDAIGQPVSVCHQWSITGTFSISSVQRSVSGSQRSPARNCVRKADRSYFASSLPSGSSLRIARIAVGAVNMQDTLCPAITRQNAPASGVPTGLPSYSTVAQPCSSGA